MSSGLANWSLNVVEQSHRADDGKYRELVSWSDVKLQWRWVLVIEGGKTHAGWAQSRHEALLAISLAKSTDPVAHIVTIRSRTGFQPPS